MFFEQTEYYSRFLQQYEAISALNEPYDLSVEHSQQFLSLFLVMAATSREIAKIMWPAQAVEILVDKRTGEEYPEIDYEKELIGILRNYKNNTTPFTHYYIKAHRNNIYRNAARIKLRQENSVRSFKISTRKQAKINKLLSVLIKYNTSNPEHQLNLFSKEARTLFDNSDKITFKDEIPKLLDIYQHAQGANINLENINSERNTEPESIFNEDIDLYDFLNLFLNFVDQGYKKKIKVKKQNSQAQAEKEEFLKQIVSCYYFTKFYKSNDFKALDFQELYDCFSKRTFASPKILNAFKQREEEILQKLYKTSDGGNEKTVIPNTMPVNLKKLSEEFKTENKRKRNSDTNGNRNYGTKRITDFRQFLRLQLQELSENPLKNKTAIDPEIIELIAAMI